MSYSVVFADQAKADLREIYEYIALGLRSKINADRQLQRIEREVLSLSEMPERYKQLPLDLCKGRNVRIVTVDHYCVIYHVTKEAETVEILRILYGGRDMETELSQKL